jgi:predicted Zn-dependent protease
MLTEEEARRVIQRVLALSQADDVEIRLRAEETSHLRFARNSPSTSGFFADHSLTVESSFGQRSASASVNQLDDATLLEVVRRSEALARLAPEDPEHMAGLGPQTYPTVTGYDAGAARSPEEHMARGTALCIEQARARGLVAAGFSTLELETSVIGNRRGLFGYTRSSRASFSMTARTGKDGLAPDAMRSAIDPSQAPAPDGDAAASGSISRGSGWASSVAGSAAGLDYAGCAATAIDKAVRSREPRELPPGKYLTVLEPSCVASLVGSLIFDMDARSADEGRSFFSAPEGKSRLGEQLFPESIDIASDPSDREVPGMPWGADGMPQSARRWIERGRVASLSCDRFWAQKQQREAIPAPSNILMQGGQGSLQELIAGTARGVLITSFWYIRDVDPRTLLLTGLTRDGVFWIEDGKIAYPVRNFRWNDSPVRVLKNVEAMSRSARVLERNGDGNVRVPALRVKDFELTSVSDAV